MSTITYSINRMGHLTLKNANGRDLYVQSDMDMPGIATTFGWSPINVIHTNRCEHHNTDGTVDCPACGCSAGDFIENAIDWLYKHEGESTDDPGYFEGGMA